MQAWHHLGMLESTNHRHYSIWLLVPAGRTYIIWVKRVELARQHAILSSDKVCNLLVQLRWRFPPCVLGAGARGGTSPAVPTSSLRPVYSHSSWPCSMTVMTRDALVRLEEKALLLLLLPVLHVLGQVGLQPLNATSQLGTVLDAGRP